MNEDSGFTLIELMIVVAIIGILVAVGMPQYQNYVARSQVAEGLSLASGIKTAISEYYGMHGTFPPGNVVATNHDVLGIAASTELTGNYVRKIEVKKRGGLQVFLKTEAQGAHSVIASKTFWLIPTDNAGSISWHCACGAASNTCNGGGEPSGKAIKEKYLPSSCLGESAGEPDSSDDPDDPGDPGDPDDTDPVPWNSIADGDACGNEAYAGTRDDGNGWVQGKASETFGAGLSVQDYLKNNLLVEHADRTCCLDKNDYVTYLSPWKAQFTCK